MIQVRTLLIVALAACGDGLLPPGDDVTPDASIADDPLGARHPGLLPRGPSCPALSSGVVRCSDLAPECANEVPPEIESGLHCLPEYRGDRGVPCFCVGISTADSWCVRDPE